MRPRWSIVGTTYKRLDRLRDLLCRLADAVPDASTASVRLGMDAVEEGVDDGGAAGAVGGVGEGAVDHQGVMEGGLAGFQLDGDGMGEELPLLVV